MMNEPVIPQPTNMAVIAREHAVRAAESAQAANALLVAAKELWAKTEQKLAERQTQLDQVQGALGTTLAKLDEANNKLLGLTTMSKVRSAVKFVRTLEEVPTEDVGPVFVVEQDAVMRWWDIEICGTGSFYAESPDSTDRAMYADLKDFHGYADVNLGALMWFPSVPLRVSPMHLMKGMVRVSETIRADTHPALSALLAYYGMLEPTQNGTFHIRSQTNSKEPYLNYTGYIVAF